MADEIITEVTPPHRKSTWAKVGIFFTLLGLLTYISVFSAGYLELAKANHTLLNLLFKMQQTLDAQQSKLNDVQNELKTFQSELKKTDRLAQQQEALQAEWHAAKKGDLHLWQASEARYLVSFANDQYQLSHQTPLSLAFLQRAEQILKSIDDPAVLPIRELLAKNLLEIKSVPQIDITGIYLRLAALNQRIDLMPLMISEPALANETSLNAPSSNDKKTVWWREGLNRSIDALRQVVTVRRYESSAMPFIMPEQKFFLFQNLHAQLQNAMWGALEQKSAVYQVSLNLALSWIKLYFNPNDAATQGVMSEIEALKAVNIESSKIDLSPTLTRFDAYLSSLNHPSANTAQ